eukprot:scaffold482825_cov83-Attheya_sp.AAC.1
MSQATTANYLFVYTLTVSLHIQLCITVLGYTRLPYQITITDWLTDRQNDLPKSITLLVALQ